MTNKEAIKFIKIDFPSYEAHSAIALAIKALEDNPKLENALKFSCEQLVVATDYTETECRNICPCYDMPDCRNPDCIKAMMNAFKTKAGIEVQKNG